MPGSQRKFLGIFGILAACLGLLSALTPVLTPQATAVCGVAFVGLFLVFQGIKWVEKPVSGDEFYAASADLAAMDTTDSLAATWVMLGSVVLANMFLGPALGWLSFWVALTWGWAFLVTHKFVPIIRSEVRPGETLHSFLARVYQFPAFRPLAGAFTFFIGVGVFAIEIAVGLALIQAFFPGNLSSASLVLVAVLLVSMCAAIALGGLRSVIRSDAMMWPLVLISMFALALMSAAVYLFVPAGVEKNFTKHLIVPLDFFGVSIFILGIMALQLPLLLSDYGTWQRIRATSFNESGALGGALRRLARGQSFSWALPILAGILIASSGLTYPGAESPLYGLAAPLMDVVHAWVSQIKIPVLDRLLIFVLLAGLLCVLASTANSYLLIALETWTKDLFPHPPREMSARDADDPVSRGRRLLPLFAIAGCLPAILLLTSGLNLIWLISVVFAVQVALAPLISTALLIPDAGPAIRRFALYGAIGGVSGALLVGVGAPLIGVGGPVGDWLQVYGAFVPPILALSLSYIGVAVGLAIKREVRDAYAVALSIFSTHVPGTTRSGQT